MNLPIIARTIAYLIASNVAGLALEKTALWVKDKVIERTKKQKEPSSDEGEGNKKGKGYETHIRLFYCH